MPAIPNVIKKLPSTQLTILGSSNSAIPKITKKVPSNE